MHKIGNLPFKNRLKLQELDVVSCFVRKNAYFWDKFYDNDSH